MQEHRTTQEVNAAVAESEGAELLRPLMEGPGAAPSAPIYGMVVGELVALDAHGAPVVSHPHAGGVPGIARSVIALREADIGAALVLLFESGDPALPLVMGRVLTEDSPPAPLPGAVEVEADGARVQVSAKDQLVLRCGEASITLTAAGKVSIRGVTVTSHATQANCIQGGSVQLN